VPLNGQLEDGERPRRCRGQERHAGSRDDATVFRSSPGIASRIETQEQRKMHLHTASRSHFQSYEPDFLLERPSNLENLNIAT
jgi:hypothetical protein